MLPGGTASSLRADTEATVAGVDTPLPTRVDTDEPELLATQVDDAPTPTDSFVMPSVPIIRSRPVLTPAGVDVLRYPTPTTSLSGAGRYRPWVILTNSETCHRLSGPLTASLNVGASRRLLVTRVRVSRQWSLTWRVPWPRVLVRGMAMSVTPTRLSISPVRVSRVLLNVSRLGNEPTTPRWVTGCG